MSDKPSNERAVISMAVMAMQANNRFDEETAKRLLQVFDAGYIALEARFSKMGEALGDGGDLESAADLLQTATNDWGLDQSFNNNPYATSDYLRKLADLAGES